MSGWTVTASIAKKPNAIAASVAASPSMLSSRLNAFVTPDQPDDRDRVADALVADELHLRPVASTIAAAPTCAASFASGLRP